MSLASFAAALGSQSRESSPVEGMSLGQATYEGLRDEAFAKRVAHFMADHGVSHPLPDLSIETASPVEKAQAILGAENVRGHTPNEWIAMSKAESLQALRPSTPVADTDLVSAVARLSAAAGSPLTGAERAQVAANADALPLELRAPLARLVDATAASYEAQSPLADVIMARAYAAKDPVDIVTTDAEREAMREIAFDLLAAENQFRDEVSGLGLTISTPVVMDPLGLVIVGSTGADTFQRSTTLRGDAVLIVDLGGNDRYLQSAGGACPDLLNVLAYCNGLVVSTVLDLAGDDSYEYNAVPAVVQGAGSTGGIGILYDVQGNDRYFSQFNRLTGNPLMYYIDGVFQGAGQAGVGILLDAVGDDVYTGNVKGSFNRGITGLGQGYGGVGGLGILADGLGDDQYLTNGLTVDTGGAFQGVYTNGVSIYAGVGIQTETGLGNDAYHSWDNASTTDYYAVGFAAFGGLGIMFEDGGDDDYQAVESATDPWINPLLNCAFGTASFDGVGIFLEMGGNDLYYGHTSSPRLAWTMNEGFGGPGTGYGLHVEVSGDDGHFMSASGGAGSRTMGRGILAVDFGNVFLGGGGNMGGTYLDAGGADLYTGAAPSRDNGQWVGGADVNLVPSGLLG